MDPLDYLCVRFHFSGDFEHDGKDWVYLGGKTGLSTIEHPMLSLSELKKLADHVSCSVLALKNTKLQWKYPGDDMENALVVLDDQQSVEMMAKHVNDGGVIDIYATILVDKVLKQVKEMQWINAGPNCLCSGLQVQCLREEKVLQLRRCKFYVTQTVTMIVTMLCLL